MQNDDALQETLVWPPTNFDPSKLSLQRVNPLKGLEHRAHLNGMQGLSPHVSSGWQQGRF